MTLVIKILPSHNTYRYTLHSAFSKLTELIFGRTVAPVCRREIAHCDIEIETKLVFNMRVVILTTVLKIFFLLLKSQDERAAKHFNIIKPKLKVDLPHCMTKAFVCFN